MLRLIRMPLSDGRFDALGPFAIDIMVIDADARKIPWSEVSHFDDDAMRDLMRQVVNRLYTFQLLAGDTGFQKWMARWETVALNWDDPELDAGFMKAVDRS